MGIMTSMKKIEMKIRPMSGKITICKSYGQPFSLSHLQIVTLNAILIMQELMWTMDLITGRMMQKHVVCHASLYLPRNSLLGQVQAIVTQVSITLAGARVQIQTDETLLESHQGTCFVETFQVRWKYNFIIPFSIFHSKLDALFTRLFFTAQILTTCRPTSVTFLKSPRPLHYSQTTRKLKIEKFYISERRMLILLQLPLPWRNDAQSAIS